MIIVLKDGQYRLIETRQQIKILYLDGVPYVWLFIPGIGHVLETTTKPHKPDHVLAVGNYRLYKVKNEARFSDHKHLELFAGDGQWQGYLLLTGFPTAQKKRTRIVTTDEIISANNNTH